MLWLIFSVAMFDKYRITNWTPKSINKALFSLLKSYRNIRILYRQLQVVRAITKNYVKLSWLDTIKPLFPRHNQKIMLICLESYRDLTVYRYVWINSMLDVNSYIEWLEILKSLMNPIFYLLHFAPYMFIYKKLISLHFSNSV